MGLMIILLLLLIVFVYALIKKNQKLIIIVGIIFILVFFMLVIQIVFFAKPLPSPLPLSLQLDKEYKQSNITERQYSKISNNLYYTDELITLKGKEDKEKILNYYKTISEYLAEKYPSLTFCITNFNYDTLMVENGMIINLCQMIDMAIVDESMISIMIDNGKVTDFYAGTSHFVFDDLKAAKNVSIDYIKQTTLDLAKEHSSEIFQDSSDIIKGEYYLKYSVENGFYYTVVFNHGSYVNIDTVTGNVIETYFFNGIYY